MFNVGLLVCCCSEKIKKISPVTGTKVYKNQINIMNNSNGGGRGGSLG